MLSLETHREASIKGTEARQRQGITSLHPAVIEQSIFLVGGRGEKARLLWSGMGGFFSGPGEGEDKAAFCFHKLQSSLLVAPPCSPAPSTNRTDHLIRAGVNKFGKESTFALYGHVNNLIHL